jgi:hypothetical protein
MATTRVTWFGVVVELDHLEITQITSTMNTGAAGAVTLASTLIALGILGPATVISGIAAAILRLGSAALIGCDSKQNGILLYVLWVGVPWCRSR